MHKVKSMGFSFLAASFMRGSPSSFSPDLLFHYVFPSSLFLSLCVCVCACVSVCVGVPGCNLGSTGRSLTHLHLFPLYIIHLISSSIKTGLVSISLCYRSLCSAGSGVLTSGSCSGFTPYPEDSQSGSLCVTLQQTLWTDLKSQCPVCLTLNQEHSISFLREWQLD